MNSPKRKTFIVDFIDYIGDHFSYEIETTSADQVKIELNAYYGWGNTLVKSIKEKA